MYQYKVYNKRNITLCDIIPFTIFGNHIKFLSMNTAVSTP